MKPKDAIISDDKNYRYVLSRVWDKDKKMINFIGLNPSTADADNDDPTIRKCIAYAKAWGYGGFYMTNLYAFRTTYPSELFKVATRIGEGNNKHILDIASRVDKVVMAWGVNAEFDNRHREVYSLLKHKAYCLAKSKAGFPRHPLYLKSSLTPIPYSLD